MRFSYQAVGETVLSVKAVTEIDRDVRDRSGFQSQAVTAGEGPASDHDQTPSRNPQ